MGRRSQPLPSDGLKILIGRHFPVGPTSPTRTGWGMRPPHRLISCSTGGLSAAEAAGQCVFVFPHLQVIDMPEHNPGQMGGTMRLGKRRTLFQTKNSVMSKSAPRPPAAQPWARILQVARPGRRWALGCLVLFLLEQSCPFPVVQRWGARKRARARQGSGGGCRSGPGGRRGGCATRVTQFSEIHANLFLT